jgi:ACT domain-containing protein
MMMIVDMSGASKDFEILSDELEVLGTEIGVIIKTQREDIFDKMHRI